MSAYRGRSGCLAFACLFVGLAGASEDDGARLEEIRVVDQRLSAAEAFGLGERALAETPWSFSRIRPAEHPAADRVEDLAPVGAGLLPVSVSAGMDTGVSARGFDAARVYVNGLPDIRRRYVRDLSSVGQVDFLRGHASVRFGGGSPAGVLAYSLKEADGIERKRLRGSLGGHGFARGEVDLGGMLGERAAYRFVTAAQAGGTDFDRLDIDRQSVYAALALPLGDDTVLRWDGDVQHNQRPYAFGTVLRHGRPVFGDGYIGPATRADRRYSRHALRLEQRLAGDHVLKLAYQEASVFRDETMHGFYTKVSENQLSGYYTRFDDRVDQRDLLAELGGQVRGPMGEARWAAGISSGRAVTDFSGGQNINGFRLDILNPVFNVDPARLPLSPRFFREHLNERAAWLRTEWDIGARWMLGAGVRRNEADVEADRTGAGLRPQARLRATTQAIQLLHRLTPTLSAWGNWGESSDVNTGYDRSGTLLPHRETQQHELGAHWVQREGSHLRVALYRLRQTNLPEADPLDRTASVASGERLTEGIEIEQVVFLGAWRGTAFLSVLSPRVEPSVAGRVSSEPVGVPRRIGSLAVSRTLPVAAGQLEAGARVWAMGRRYANTANTQHVAGFGRVDVLLRWRRDKHFSLSFGIQNLLDKQYVEAINGVDDVYPGARRLTVLSLEHSL